MEIASNLLLCLILFLFAALSRLLWRRQSRKVKNLQPPGPPGWPILGNFFDLGTLPHQTLSKFKPKYGPVLGLKLGSVNTVVIQSAMAASQLFKNHDHDFCDRKCPIVLTAHNYCQGTLAFDRYGQSWRMLRRICSMGLLANRQTYETAGLRRKCIDDMIRYIEKDAATAQERGEEGKVNLGHFLFLMSFNLVGNLVLSRDLLSSGSKEGKEFFDAMSEVMVWAGKPNLADFLPGDQEEHGAGHESSHKNCTKGGLDLFAFPCGCAVIIHRLTFVVRLECLGAYVAFRARLDL
ncbi:hypothetical protein V6N13_041562 [Hibiscus sabdariffa]